MKPSLQKLSESFLYHIWDEGHFRSAELRTTDGRKLEVIFRGRWNMDTGPDFKGALIKVGGQLHKGDVEIHTREGEWYQHQHHTDERYNNVILHVILWPGDKPAPAVTRAGKLLPTLVLSRFFDESVSRLQVKVNRKSPHARGRWPETCLLRSYQPEAIRSTLERWGLERLRLKKERFREERVHFSFNELYYQGLCEALGFSKNQKPFLKLALMLPLQVVLTWIKDADENAAIVMLQGLYFGAAGFLHRDEKIREKWSGETAQFMQQLSEEWDKFRECHLISAMDKTEWQFFRLRPSNFPTVRIAGLAGLLVRCRHSGFLEPTLALFRDLAARPERLLRALQELFMVPGFGFWKTHFHLDASDSNSNVSIFKLIGQGKAREIVINVTLPLIWAYAEEADDFELQSVCKQSFLRAPRLQENELTRLIGTQLGLTKEVLQNIPLSACEQQGMIHLARSMCPQWHCDECVHSGLPN